METKGKIYYKGIVKNGIKRDKHRIVMEEKLGRRLDRYEVVHHINGDIKDNRLENLKVMTLSEHSRMHMTGYTPTDEARANMSNAQSLIREKTKFIQAQAWNAMLMLNRGEPQRSVARQYGIAHQTMMRSITLELAKLCAVFHHITEDDSTKVEMFLNG